MAIPAARLKNPTYEQVCAHGTGHAEAVKVVFDPKKVSYETILRQFFRMHDPTQLNRQGPDVGDQYRSAIFYQNEEQKAEAEKLVKELNESKYEGKLATTVEPKADWYPAEDYHQKFTQRTGQGICHVAYKPL